MDRFERNTSCILEYLSGNEKIHSGKISRLIRDFPPRQLKKVVFRGEIVGQSYPRNKRRICSAATSIRGALLGAYSMFRHRFDEGRIKEKVEDPENVEFQIYRIDNPWVILDDWQVLKFGEFKVVSAIYPMSQLIKEREVIVSTENDFIPYKKISAKSVWHILDKSF